MAVNELSDPRRRGLNPANAGREVREVRRMGAIEIEHYLCGGEQPAPFGVLDGGANQGVPHMVGGVPGSRHEVRMVLHPNCRIDGPDALHPLRLQVARDQNVHG